LSEGNVTRPEFDLYIKTTSKAMTLIASSIEKSLAEIRETNQILREYIIHNNHKHDATNVRLDLIVKEHGDLKKTVLERESMFQAAKALKWGAVIILTGLLMAVGTSIWTSHELKQLDTVKAKVSK